MPLYVYRCPFGHEAEVLMSVKTRMPSLVCATCGQRADRVIAAPAAVVTSAAQAKASALGSAITRVRQAARRGKLDY